jgi:predicted ATPase
VGKTRLVQALDRAVHEQRGYFVAGKFEQLRQDRPYSALVAAFRHIIAALLAENAEHVAGWRRRISDALGDEAALVLPLIPELGVLLEQSPLAAAAITAAETKRVPRLLARMITAIAAPHHPLVLVLDDLQWADPASLQLIETVMKSPDATGLYVIGLYRDNEVTAAHPLLLTRHAIALEDLAEPDLVLEPLTVDDIQQMLVETLQCPPGEARPLAEVIHGKTSGNPFFARAFLFDLEDNQLLQFDGAARRWSWDLAALRQRKVTDNVVDLLVGKIGRLEPAVRATLQAAACLGAEFELDMLALATETAPGELVAMLSEAVEAGLVVACDRVGDRPGSYRFVHDRVEQAAYALIAVGERTALHQRIGRRMLAALTAEQRAERVFDLLYHLNHGMDGSPRPEPVAELGALNLIAGKKAKSSAAYATAWRHLALAIELVPADAWTAHYATTLELHDEAVETAFLHGDLARMNALIELIQRHAASVLDTIRAHLVKVAALIAQHKQNEVLDHVVALLGELGNTVPRHPTQLQVARLLGWTLVRFRARSIASLAALPQMTDPRRLAMTRLICEVIPTAYQASQELFVVLVLRLANMTLSHGVSDGSPNAFATVGLLLCGLVGATDYGNQIADVGAAPLPVIRHEFRALPRFILAASVRHWKYPLRDTLPTLLEASREGMESGQVEAAALSLHMYCMHAYYAGRDLQVLAREAADYSAAMRRMQHVSSLEHNERVRQSVLNLIGDSAAPWQLEGEAYDERTIADHRDDKTQLASVFVEKLALASLFQQYDVGLDCLPRAAAELDAIRGLATTAFFQFHAALVQLGAAATAAPAARRRLVRRAKALLGWLDRRARGAPANFMHKAALVRAELHRVEGRDSEALDAYERAIALATEHEYTSDEALANELAARFHTERDRNTIAHAYLTAARAAYSRWGATAKVRQLDERFPWLVRTARSAAFSLGAGSVGAPSIADVSTTQMGGQIDIESVVKASQSLSSIVALPELIAKLMDIVVENAGAEHGYLILRRGDRLIVESHRSLDVGRVAAFAPIALDACRDLAASVVHYVARTRVPVVLGDAATSGAFLGDAYVLRTRPRSVIAVPILRNGELDGVLYLENNQASDAFTPDRVELLSLLSSQAAISIENATLYEDMEARVQQRTVELADANGKLTSNIELLQRTQRELVEASRMAGMADVAATVLHEVGNALNGVTTAAGVARDRVRDLRIAPLHRVAQLLEQRDGELAGASSDDDKARPLAKYLTAAAAALGDGQQVVLRELEQLSGMIEVVAGAVAAQRVHIAAQTVIERVAIAPVIDQALGLVQPALDARAIAVVREYEPLADAVIDRYKLLRVLRSLMASSALAEAGEVDGANGAHAPRRLVVRAHADVPGRFAITIHDSGAGWSPDQLATLFSQGVTPAGDAFSLHTAACSVIELDGALSADSDGVGRGTTFRLVLPQAPVRTAA